MKKQILLASTALILSAGSAHAQTKIGVNPATINPNSILELETSNKGLLLPRVALTSITSASPLTAHVQGMAVYNTTSSGSGATDVSPGVYYNTGSGWLRLITVAPTPFTIEGTSTDAGGDKLSNIHRGGSISIGNSSTTAQGTYSIASGNFTNAPGDFALAVGSYDSAIGNASIASGSFTKAIGTGSFSTGANTIASGGQSIALGITNTASGTASLVHGFSSTASGNYSFAMGQSVVASGNRSLTFGQSNTASAESSVLIGRGLSSGIFAGSMLLGDASSGGASSAADNSFTAHFIGGYRLFSANANNTGVQLPAGTSTWASISDKRAKTNIKPVAYGLSTILKLHPTSYNYNGQTSTSLGFIAQEMLQEVPEIVNVPEDKNAFMSIRYSELIPVLTKAIQEQEAKITALEAANKELKATASRVAQLENQMATLLSSLQNQATETQVTVK